MRDFPMNIANLKDIYYLLLKAAEKNYKLLFTFLKIYVKL